MRQFEDCALAFLEVQSGMRSLACDFHRERADTFARSLQRASRACGLTNQHRGTLPGHSFGDRARAVAASLFVGNQKHLDRPRQVASSFAQRSQREHHLRDAAFHVENAGPVEPSILFAPRHGRNRFHLINRIEVSQQQHRPAPLGPAKIHLQVVAGDLLAMNLRPSTDALELHLQVRAQLITGQLVAGRRFAPHQLAHARHHFALALAQPLQNLAEVVIRSPKICLTHLYADSRALQCAWCALPAATECIIVTFTRPLMSDMANPAPDSGDNLTLDIEDILRILPHRYPFLLVDRIIHITRTKRIVAIKNVTVNEPFFAGHFPDHPIMPGVLVVEAMAQAGGVLLLTEFPDRAEKLLLFTGIERARFRRPVRPGDQLRIEVDVLAWRGTAGRMQGKAYLGEKLACEAVVTCRLLNRSAKSSEAASSES